jgi:hypothetical protein
VPYATADARQQLLDTLAEAADDLALALAALTEAFEQLDDASGERLEQELFGSVQSAYGRARRTHTGFAQRHGLPERAFAPAPQGAPGRGVKTFIDDAVVAVARADTTLGTLQDSMLPVEVGDPGLRAGLVEVRAALAGVSSRAHQFERTLGR